MTFEILLHPHVERFLRKLDKSIADRIRAKLRKLKENPFRYLEHHAGEDVFKLRIGEFRALVDADLKTQTLLVRHLDHRRRIYKRKRRQG